MPHSRLIDDRLNFLEFDKDTVFRLRQAKELLEPKMDQMLDSFYDHILSQPKVRNLFADDVAVERARSSQRRHWLTTLLDGILDSSYFDKANRIGIAHARIGLTPDLYIGGYCQMLGQFTDVLLQDKSLDRVQLSEVIHALQKAVFLDIDLVIHCYLDAKDAMMRDLLRRNTNFVKEVELDSEEIGKTADLIVEASKHLIGREDSLDRHVDRLRKQTAELNKQVFELKSRLEKAETEDRLVLIEAPAETGTFTRIKVLFGIDDKP